MTLFDSVDMCLACAVPVEGSRKCPECGGKLTRVDARAFQSVVVLTRKGYRVVRIRSLGTGKNKFLKLWFRGQSPGPGVHGEMKCTYDKGMPACETKPWEARDRFGKVKEWADEATELLARVPFNRDLCKRCARQDDARWYGGTCKCPMVPNMDFEMGLPDKCTYLVEQQVTREDVKRNFLASICED